MPVFPTSRSEALRPFTRLSQGSRRLLLQRGLKPRPPRPEPPQSFPTWPPIRPLLRHPRVRHLRSLLTAAPARSPVPGRRSIVEPPHRRLRVARHGSFRRAIVRVARPPATAPLSRRRDLVHLRQVDPPVPAPLRLPGLRAFPLLKPACSVRLRRFRRPAPTPGVVRPLLRPGPPAHRRPPSTVCPVLPVAMPAVRPALLLPRCVPSRVSRSRLLLACPEASVGARFRRRRVPVPRRRPSAAARVDRAVVPVVQVVQTVVPAAPAGRVVVPPVRPERPVLPVQLE